MTALDGLRGVAALVVVIHHALLLVPALADAYYEPSTAVTRSGGLEWLLTYSPLHLFWAGPEAVLLFFVLSGVVLTMPALRTGFSWVAYYPRRVIRLYVPVIAAIGFAAATIAVAPRLPEVTQSAWVAARPAAFTAEGLVKDVTLVNGVSRTLSPLWSLEWEVKFSLLLPVYVGLALLARRSWVAAVAATALVSGVIAFGWYGNENAAYYLGVFGIGALLAVIWEPLARFVERPRPGWVSTTAWSLLGLVGAMLTIRHWLVLDRAQAAPVEPGPGLDSLVGVVLIVLVAGFFGPVKRMLERAVPRWLGKISFSLYLVHEAIVLGSFHLMPDLPVGWISALAVALSLGLAVLFTRWIEMPSHRLARRAGRAAQASVDRLASAVRRPVTD